MAMVVELYRLIALNSLPVAHFAVGHSIMNRVPSKGMVRACLPKCISQEPHILRYFLRIHSADYSIRTP
jgi:hypothetical protein